MRFIQKHAEPNELLEWRKTEKQNRTYQDMPKRAVRQSLLEEQGYLCCYTGQPIDLTSSHIEHLKPQSVSKAEGKEEETFSYENLLAAYPSDEYERNRGKCPYGAHYREDNYNRDEFITPLTADCEKYFHFDLFGKIAPRSPQDKRAEYTIRLLYLDHPELDDLRKQAIRGALFMRKLRPGQLQRIADSYSTFDGNGKLRPYCFVIQQVAQDLLPKTKQGGVVRKRINKANKVNRKSK